jgi:pimeloyl-ACP methyl ester carboxylesterase
MANQLNFHIEIRGEGQPIYPLHGWNGNLEDMLWLYEPLFESRPNWKRIYFDLPGHGRTPGPDWITDASQLAQATWEMMLANSGGQPFALSGFSYAGYIALSFANQHPEKLLGLAGLNPVVVSDFESRLTPAFEVAANDGSFSEMLPAADAEALAGIIATQTRPVAQRLLSMQDGPIADQEFLNSIRSDPQRFHIAAAEAPLAQPFEQPSLFITGKQDQISGYEQVRARLPEFPGAHFELLEGAGHLAYVEHTDQVRHLLGQWLDAMQDNL